MQLNRGLGVQVAGSEATVDTCIHCGQQVVQVVACLGSRRVPLTASTMTDATQLACPYCHTLAAGLL
jgi:DNA-directed RNA polymerase subunit RPC12/RpoP